MVEGLWDRIWRRRPHKPVMDAGIIGLKGQCMAEWQDLGSMGQEPPRGSLLFFQPHGVFFLAESIQALPLLVAPC